MDALVVIVIVALLAVAAIGAWYFYSQSQRSKGLRDRFGAEYDATLEQAGKRSDAERELASREQRVEKLHLKEIPSQARQGYIAEWQMVQTRFVDDPALAIKAADSLCERVMDARGYPLAGFDQQAADISVDHPVVVQNYRAAHTIAQASADDRASTEDLRQGMIHYRALFDDLLGTAVASRS